MNFVEWSGLALILDLLIGDPRWLPHPVRGLGWLISRCDRKLRETFPRNEKGAGIALALFFVSGTYGISLVFVLFFGHVHPFLGGTGEVLLIYFSLAPRDLSAHGLRVFRALKKGDLETARDKVSMMVGRDVRRLDREGIIRAAVESIAENSVDGVIAPLFFAIIGGGPAAMAYRALNTLDSMVGYLEAPYTQFGWASARLDDLANFLPARITGWMMPIAGLLVGGSFLNGIRILRADGRKHASPNAGLPEAAMAGILGVKLRGPQWYHGVYEESPFIGIGKREIEPSDILKAIFIMGACAIFAYLFFSVARFSFEEGRLF